MAASMDKGGYHESTASHGSTQHRIRLAKTVQWQRYKTASMRPWRGVLSWLIVRQSANSAREDFPRISSYPQVIEHFSGSWKPFQRAFSIQYNPTSQSWLQRRRASCLLDEFWGAQWRTISQGIPPRGSALTPQLTDKLRDLDGRYQHSINELSQSSSELSPADLTKLHKEIGKLEPVIAKWQKFQNLTSEIDEVRSLLNDDDSGVRLEAENELAQLREQVQALEQDLILALLPRDKDDERSVLLEIRPGPGGEEAALFAADLFKMYSLFAAGRGWRFEVLQEGNTLVALVEGDSVFQQLKFENGVHRVQRVPVTETKGRIHTSTASVVVMPQPDDVSVDIQEKDLKIETMRASGAGGQHVNTTDSAVRITHLPTGLSVHNMGERSQHKNKAQALKILTARLYDMERYAATLKKVLERERLERKSAIGTGDRSERIRTYNFPENRIVDHRVGITVNGISEMLLGQKMDSFIEALELKDKYAKMASMGNSIDS